MTSKLIVLFAFIAIAGTRVNLDESASIVFPAAPRQKQVAEQAVYTLSTDKYVYYATYADLAHLDTSSASELVIQTNAYQAFIQGIFASAGIDNLIEEKDFQISRHNGKQIMYFKSFGNRSNVKVVSRIVLIGKRMYQFEVWGLNGEVEKKVFTKFFESVEINN